MGSGATLKLNLSIIFTSREIEQRNNQGFIYIVRKEARKFNSKLDMVEYQRLKEKIYADNSLKKET